MFARQDHLISIFFAFLRFNSFFLSYLMLTHLNRDLTSIVLYEKAPLSLEYFYAKPRKNFLIH